jgi:hypothetical protein
MPPKDHSEKRNEAKSSSSVDPNQDNAALFRMQLKVVRDLTKTAYDFMPPPANETIGGFSNRKAVESYKRKVESKRKRAKENRRKKKQKLQEEAERPENFP